MTKSSVCRLFIIPLVVVCLAHFSLLAKADGSSSTPIFKPLFQVSGQNPSGKVIFKNISDANFILTMGISKAYWTKNPKELTIRFGGEGGLIVLMKSDPDAKDKRAFLTEKGSPSMTGTTFKLNVQKNTAQQDKYDAYVIYIDGAGSTRFGCETCPQVYKVQGTATDPEYVMEVELIGDPGDSGSISQEVLLYLLNDYTRIETGSAPPAPTPSDPDATTPAPSGSKSTVLSLFAVGLVVGGNLLTGLHQFLAI